MVNRENAQIAVSVLKPYAQNARTHSPEQVDQIVTSMKEYGFTNPLLVDEHMTIIAGHGRLLAAVKLGMDTVPAVILTGLSVAQKKALVLADNKIALNVGWDTKLLELELKDLAALGFNLDLTGFTGIEIGKILNLGAARADENASPATPALPRSRLGDIWICGRHRVKCGDSTSATDVADALGDEKPKLMVTDPPYGVEYDPAWRNGLDKAKNRRTGVVKNDDRADWREAWALFPGNIAYIWHGALHAAVVAESLTACDFAIRAQIIWAKNKMVFGRGDYHWQHEPCWYAVKGTGAWAGDRKQTTLWTIDNLNVATHQEKENERTNHSTQKPVECMRRPILNNSAPGESVYDPFLGSGSTLIAAESSGRICVGLELTPAYVDVIVKRWQDFTGEIAYHHVTGEKFDGREPQKAPS